MTDEEQEDRRRAVRMFYQKYQTGARKRGLDFNLSEWEFATLISEPCHYCGLPPQQHVYRDKATSMRALFTVFTASGIDRLDNERGYSWENCVPCCEWCNRAKFNRSADEYLAWLEHVVSHFRG